MKKAKHRCVGQYTGVAKLNSDVYLVAYKCSGCGEVWGDKLSFDEAAARHPHLAGNTVKCPTCKKWHKPPTEEKVQACD